MEFTVFYFHCFRSVDCELQGKLQEFLTKKEKLAEEVKDALSYTYITEETMLQGVVTGITNDFSYLLQK